MVVYLAFIIPVLSSLLLYVLYKHKVQWWEVIVPMVITLIFVLVAKWISVKSLILDTEWLGGYVTEVRYYEDWDERVSCRHPIYCSRTVCSGSGKNRTCHTERYVCGHVHPYDVDYHPEYWTAETTLGRYSITKEKYNRLVNQFGTGKAFVELNRDYHSNDGDMYKTIWSQQRETLEPVTITGTYENRPKASHSIYHFQELDSFEIKQYKPFDYPPIFDQYKQNTLLGYDNKNAQHKLQVVNSLFGASREVRVFLVIFKNQPREAGFIQERYWEGGNMNEIVVCVGIDDQENVKWGHVFSWTESTGVKVKIKNEIESEKKMDLDKIIDLIEDEVKFEWKRKDFHDFDYLNIYPTVKQTIWIFILTIVINIGIGVWIVRNEFEDFDHKKRKKYWK